jgi:DNA-binding MarR family transcriptional regulator
MSMHAEPAGADQLYAVLQYVRPLHRHVAQAVADRLAGTGLTVGHRAVLERLALDGPSTVPQIGHALALPRQAVQRYVNDLLAADLARARPNPLHRRSHLIAPTEAGTDRLASIRSAENDSLSELGDRLTADDAAAAVRVMAALTAHFRELTETARAGGLGAPDQTLAVDTDVRPTPPGGRA